jgi:predicted nucleic acid-binding protein
VKFLVDTNVIAELRKGARAHALVRAWFEALDPESIFLSVLTLGEIRKGIESVRRKDPNAARALDRWVRRIVTDHGNRIVAVDRAIAEEWGRLNVPDPLPAIDGLLAATARIHGFTLVTRNDKDVIRTGVLLLNPFKEQKSA